MSGCAANHAILRYDGMMNCYSLKPVEMQRKLTPIRQHWHYIATCWIAIGLAGCGRPAAPVVKSGPSANDAPTNSIDSIRDVLRRPFAEPDQLRLALDQLSATKDKAGPLDTSIVDVLKSKLLLTDADVKEVNRPEYSPLDAHVVYQAMFFADAARTLEVGKASIAEKAQAALGWVNRHIRTEERDGPPDPPALVSQRGTGTPLERIYVLAAICHALHLDAWLVGDAEAAGNTSRLWGVGIVQGDDVLLLDARLGISLPGPKGSVGTLRQLSQDGSPLNSLVELGYDVTPDRVKAARLFPASSLTALAPRMKLVEAAAPPGTRIGVDAKKHMESAAKLPIAGWEPKTRGTPVRTLAEFLPPDDGGVDKPLPGQPTRVNSYKIGLLPWDVYPRSLDQFPSVFGQQLRSAFVAVAGCDRQPGISERIKRRAEIFEGMRNQAGQEKEGPSDPRLQNDIVQSLSRGMRATAVDDQGPTLRQLMLRGQYSETTAAADALSDPMRVIRNRDMGAKSQTVDDWAQKVQAAYLDGQQARQRGDAQRVAAAEKTLAELRAGLPQAEAFVQWLAAGPALAKLAFLTATVKHDQAFAISRRDPKPEVWKTTIALWDAYVRNYSNTTESHHAQRMLADALAASGQKAAAASAYKKAADQAKSPMDKMACTYLATIVNQQ